MNCEILAPAGDEQSARAALYSGANAIYLGLTRFSARSSAENFDASALERIIKLAHLLDVKVYVCLNTLVKDSETDAFFASAREAWNCGVDAILVQDLFLGKKLKEVYPEIVLHLSTQAGCCNEYGARLARDCGFSRVVLARETPLSEIGKIAKLIETEIFVQGALCTCFSGQCYLSSFAGNNSGNRGRCKQPCRKRYTIDREGFKDYAYALSPSDLSVGARVKEFLEAGVVSLKIEGRMRRPEYVAAAVRYYRTLLDGKNGEREFSDLRRAYNRGDYTFGLAFGQKDFLSRKVQGHIGERVGFLDGKGFVKSEYPARKGDGFKILRDGYEVGGAVLRESGKGGFSLTSSERLREGDEVRLTTDASLEERQFAEKKKPIALSLRFAAGERASIGCGEFHFFGNVLEKAKSAPITREELENCFKKTDGLPFEISFESVETEGAFLPKSALNALRRSFYEELINSFLPQRMPLPEREISAEIVTLKSRRIAVISAKLQPAEILVYKPNDYTRIDAPQGAYETFLYLPPFFTSEDIALIEKALPDFDGIYCDGYYGLLLAKESDKKFFAGTGFNLTNRFAVSGVKSAGANYFALSKELNTFQQQALAAEGAFVLGQGAIKVMDLCYCPFERTCGFCDKREIYHIKDEDGREFPLRRYRVGGEPCRFELYNCAPLAEIKGAMGTIHDKTVRAKAPPTKGHSERSML